jgi:MFS family permease
MSSADPAPRRWFLDLTPLRASPAYARMWIGGVFSGIGSQLTIVAIGIQLYDITGSTTAVAAVGGIALVPMVLVGIFGGPLIDAVDRRTVVIAASIVAWMAVVGIALLSWFEVTSLAPYYALTTVSAATGTLVGTARFAIHPRLVDREHLPAASALSGISAGLQGAVGPALAGILVATVGYAWTYTIDVALFIVGCIGIFTLPRIPPTGSSRLGLAAVAEGIRFIRSAVNIRTAIAIHLLTLVFARPYALFPAVAAVLIGGGPVTVGILTASAAAGTVLSGAFSGPLGGIRAHGTAIARAASTTALFILLLSFLLIALTVLPHDNGPHRADPLALTLACIALAGAGAADNVAGIFRTTMLQSAAPDEVRGRMQGLFTLVLTAGPRLGDVFVGVVAAAGALWAPPLLGAAIVLVGVAVLVRNRPLFRSYDALEPVP